VSGEVTKVTGPDLTAYARLTGDLDAAELYFNAGRLDRSVALATEDYLRIASPKVAPITARL